MEEKVITTNRSATHEYFILEKKRIYCLNVKNKQSLILRRFYLIFLKLCLLIFSYLLVNIETKTITNITNKIIPNILKDFLSNDKIPRATSAKTTIVMKPFIIPGSGIIPFKTQLKKLSPSSEILFIQFIIITISCL